MLKQNQNNSWGRGAKYLKPSKEDKREGKTRPEEGERACCEDTRHYSDSCFHLLYYSSFASSKATLRGAARRSIGEGSAEPPLMGFSEGYREPKP